MMQRVLRILAGLVGLLMLAMGLTFLLAPSRLMGPFAVRASSNAGFSTVRGDLGGLFIGMAIFTLIGAIRASSRWLAVPCAFLGFIVLGRILNLLFDGRSAEGVQAVILELVLIVVLLLTIASLQGGRRPFGRGLWIAIPVLLLMVLGAAFVFQRQIGMAITKQVAERAFQNQLLAGLPDGLHTGLCGSGSPLPAGVRELMFYHTIPPLPLAYVNAAFLGDGPNIFTGPIVVGKDGMLLSLAPGGTSIAMRELL